MRRAHDSRARAPRATLRARRGVPQLVEAQLWVLRVVGSNPISPTIFRRRKLDRPNGRCTLYCRVLHMAADGLADRLQGGLQERPDASLPWVRRVGARAWLEPAGLILVCGGVYGAAMGLWRAPL